MATRPRTYGQRCGLAFSLDLLGERWTLLILRELDRGPKRFGDLLEGLDGIGSNLLSARLKSLQEAEVVEQVILPPPVSSPAYGLAERGLKLQPILEDLALWGFELIPDLDQSPELTTKATWAAMSMKAAMDRNPTSPPEGIFGFEVGAENFWLRVSDGESILRDGPPPFEPDAAIRLSGERFFGVASGRLALADSQAEIRGDLPRLEALLCTFRLPE